MPSRYCLHCQTAFGDGTGKAKYCSAKCRRLAFEARQRTGETPAPRTAPAVVQVGGPAVGPMEAAVLAEVGEAAALSVAGVNATLIARQLDSGEEKGTAVAALSRQLQLLVEEAKRSPGAKRDVVDELADRRTARRGA